MDSNDTKQTHKQYVAREKRIKVCREYDDKIETVSNEIQNIDNQMEKLRIEREKKVKSQQQIKEQKYQKMLPMYNQPGVMDEIIQFGKRTTCSRVILEDVRKSCENGVNVDSVDLDMIDNLNLVDNEILKNIPHTNIIGDLLDKVGGSIKFLGEEDGEDEKDGN